MKYWIIPFAALFLFLTACQSGETTESTGSDADTTATEQEETSEKPLLSPPDSTMATLGDLTVKVNYGSPSVRERAIWGELVPYGEIWRTGANEATTLMVDSDATINGEALPAGTYALFTIPGEEIWTVILNKDAEQWGAYEYNEEEDALRFEVTPTMGDELHESMAFKAEAGDDAITVHFHWEKLSFQFMVAPAE